MIGTTIPSAAFRSEAIKVADAARTAFADAIESACGGAPRAQDVAEKFGVHRKLGWQIWNVAYGDEPLPAIRFMPSSRSVEAWRFAAAEKGVPGDLLERVDAAVRAYDRLVETHAADRELLDMMVEQLDTTVDDSTENRWRKQAFTGNSFIWGVRVRTMLSALFLHPSKVANFFDMARIQGLVGLIRTRHEVRWPFAQSVIHTDDVGIRYPRREPLMPSPDVDTNGVPLMTSFCSQPTPPVQRRMGDSGLLEDELLPGPVGQTGACTVITGEILREAAPSHATEPDEDAMFGVGVRTPAELLLCDHFVHKDIFPGVVRELCVFSELVSPTTRDPRDRLPVGEKIQSLGRGLGRIRTAEVPQYAEMVNYVMDRSGWKADEFEVFRIRMKYPPMPVSVMVRHPLPPGV